MDVIFFIWTSTKTDLENFYKELNRKYPSKLNLNMKYQKKEFHFSIPKYTLKTNCIPKYLEGKQTTKPFLTSTQSVQNR